LGIVDSWSRPSNLANVVIFILGGVIMRSAGCVINDYADRHVDEHAERTQHRPPVAGPVQHTFNWSA
tara:strand:+ start:1803 stop:2003 length:201 start_codon:yes stop_codon:yes gene_type:complete